MVSFVDATAMHADPGAAEGPDTYRCAIPDGWNSPFGLHGGVFAATASRAAEQAHGVDGLTIRSLHARYLERPESGELVATPRVIRTGGITAFVEVDAWSEGQARPALRLGALYTRAKSSRAFLDAVPPDVPPPDACTTQFNLLPTGASPPAIPGMPDGPPPLFRQLDIRSALGVMPWEPGWTSGQPARYVRWGRFVERPALADGGIDPLCMLVYADLPAPALWATLGPDDPFHTMVSLELTFHVLERPSDDWLLVDTRARWMGDGYLLTETDLWSAGRLCATSNQMMLVRVLG